MIGAITLTSCAMQAIRTTIGAADEGVEDAADQQHVLEIVDVLEQRAAHAASPIAFRSLSVLLALVVPDVPLVEARS